MAIVTTSIQRFLDQIKKAAQTRSRDLRIEMAEATILAAEIGVLLSRVATAESQSGIKAVTMDGGSLTSK